MSVTRGAPGGRRLRRRAGRSIDRRHRLAAARVGRRPRRRQVLTNAHNIRGDETTVTFADGRTAGAGRRRRRRRRPRRDRRRHRPARRRSSGATAPRVAVGAAVFGAAATPRRRDPSHLRARVRGRARVPRPGRPTDRRQRRAHRAARAGLVRRGAARRGGQLVGINTNRIGEGFYLALPADAELRQRIDALGRGESPTRPRLGVAVAPSHVARRLRRSVGLPARDGLLVRGVEDGSLAPKAGHPRRRPHRRGRGPGGERGRRAVEALLGKVELPFEVKLVRGTEERTVSVGGGDATGGGVGDGPGAGTRADGRDPLDAPPEETPSCSTRTRGRSARPPSG